LNSAQKAAQEQSATLTSKFYLTEKSSDMRSGTSDAHIGNALIGFDFPPCPQAPITAKTQFNGLTLRETKQALSTGFVNAEISEELTSMLSAWKADSSSVDPISALQNIVEKVRTLPPGDERIAGMNTVISVLGQPENLATYLDMMRDSATREGTLEQRLVQEQSIDDASHSKYGWLGQLALLEYCVGDLSRKFKSSNQPIQDR
jgi:hypothetical protein